MSAMRFRAGGRTQTGPHPGRESVDSLLLDPQLGLFLVLDAGGSWSELRWQSGRTAAEVIRRVIAQRFSTDSEPRLVISEAFQAADAALRAEPDENGWHGGAAVALALLRDQQVFVSWLGDVMAYHVMSDRIEALTQPHTLWNESIRRGLAPINPAYHNLLTHVLGGELPEPPTVISFFPQPGDRLILATDGVTNHVPEDTLLNACLAISDPTTCAEAVIAHAITAGSRDDCTCAVVAFE